MCERTEYTDLRECMACMHNFAPDTLADLSCPYCGGPSMAVSVQELVDADIEKRKSTPPTMKVDPDMDVTTLCPTCEGARDNGHHDPQWVVDCSHCGGDGVVDATQREAFGSPIFDCQLCGQGMLPDYGMKLGVIDPGSSDCPGQPSFPTFCCEDCLADPDNRDEIHGVIVTPRERHATKGASWRWN